MERIHLSKIWSEMEKRDINGKPLAFSLSFVKKGTGEIRNIASCTLSSNHTKGPTLNILSLGDTKPKSIRKCLIISFNNKSVYQ